MPKLRDGRVEAIRALRVARSSAVKARSQATNQIKALLISGPPELREQLRHLPTAKIIAGCARLRPGPQLSDPTQATKTALRRLARRHQQLSEEIADADLELAQLVADVAPDLLILPGVGPEVAGQLLTSAGDNPDRITSEAKFAHLCGVAPIPASSGRTHRHRLNRGGDRQANNALYIVVINRLRHDPRSRAYAQRRSQQGLSKPEIIRCFVGRGRGRHRGDRPDLPITGSQRQEAHALGIRRSGRLHEHRRNVSPSHCGPHCISSTPLVVGSRPSR